MLPRIQPGIYEQIQQQVINQEREKQWDQRHHLGSKIPEVQHQMKGLDKYIQDFNKNKETLNNSILLAASSGRPYTQKMSYSPIKNRRGVQQTPFSQRSLKYLSDANNILPSNIELETMNNNSETNFYSYVKRNQELEEKSHGLLNRINELFEEFKFEQFHRDYFNYFIQQHNSQDMNEILQREIKLIEARQSPYQLVSQTITEREKRLRSLIDAVEQIDASETWENDLKVLQIFQKMAQLREFTIQVIERINYWRRNLINIPSQQMQQPQIELTHLTYYFAAENYLLKLYYDSSFLSQSNLSHKIPLSIKHDPFLIYPTKLILEKQQTNPTFLSSFDLNEDIRNRILKAEKILINEITQESEKKNVVSPIKMVNRSMQEGQKTNLGQGRGIPNIKNINSSNRENSQGQSFIKHIRLMYRKNASSQDNTTRLNKSENKISSNNISYYDNGQFKPQSTIVFKRVKSSLKNTNNHGSNINQNDSLPLLQQQQQLQSQNKLLSRNISTGLDKQRGKSELDLRRQSRDFITLNNDMTALLRKKRDSKLYEAAPIVLLQDKQQLQEQQVKPKIERECCSNLQELNEKGFYTKILPEDEPYYMKLNANNTSFRTLRKSNSSSPSKRRFYSQNQTSQNTIAGFYNGSYNTNNNTKSPSPRQDQLPIKKVIRFFTLEDELSQHNNDTQLNQTTQENDDQQSPQNIHNIIVLGSLDNQKKEIQILPKQQSPQSEQTQEIFLPNQSELKSQTQSIQKSQNPTSIRLQSESQLRESIQIKSKLNDDSLQDKSIVSPSKATIRHKDSSFMLEENSNSHHIKRIQSQNVLPDYNNSRIQEEDTLPETHSEMLFSEKKKNRQRSNMQSREAILSPLRKKNSVKKLDPLDKDQSNSLSDNNKQQTSSQQSGQPQKIGSFQYVRSKSKGKQSKTGIYPNKDSSKSPNRQQFKGEEGTEKIEGDKMFRSLVLNRKQQQEEGNNNTEQGKGIQEKQQKSSLKKVALALIKQKQEEDKALLEAAQKQKEYEKQLKNNQEYNDFLRREQEQKLQNISNQDLEEALTNEKQNPFNTNAFKVSIQVVPVSLKEEDVNGIVHNYFKKIHPFFSGLFMRDAFTLIYQLKNDLNFNFLQAVDRRTMQVLGLLVVHPYFDYGQQKGPFDFFDDPPPKESENNPLSDEDNFLKNEDEEEINNDDPNNLFNQSQYSQQNGMNSFFSSKTTLRQQNKLLSKQDNNKGEVRKIMIIDHFSCIDINMFKGLFSLFTEYIWTHDVADSIEVKLYTSPQLVPLQEKIEQMITPSNFQFTKQFQDNTQRVFSSVRDEEKYPIDENLLGDAGKTPDQLFFNSFIMVSKQEIPENRIFNKSLYVDNGQRFNFLCALSHLFKEMYISDILLKLKNENQHEKIKQLYSLAYTMRLNIRKKKVFSDLFINQEFDNIEKMNIAIERMSLLPTCEYDDNASNKIYMNTFSLRLNLPHACHTVMSNSEEKQMLYMRIANNSNQIDSSMASTSNSTPLVSAIVYSKITSSPMIQIQTVDTKYTLFFLQADDYVEKQHNDLYLYINEFFKEIESKEATYKTIWLPQFQINFPHIRNDDFDSVLSKNRVFSSLNFSFKLPDYIGGKLLYQEPSMQKSVYVRPPFIFGIIDNQFDIHMPNEPLFSCFLDENDVLYFNKERTNQCLLYIDKEVDDGPIQGYPKITGIQNNIERSNQSKNYTSALRQAYKEKVMDSVQ